MSDYALMRKMHDTLKTAQNELEWLAQSQPDETAQKIQQIAWDIQIVLNEAEGR
jgi:hypothetical protein